ncbi:putative UDP-N-acetylglucosamine--peptide N-acetylglucosaminyltransferase SEC [Choanephora cucurbitarum]|uniref:protein O-GlcNAc transferase n=1 Tax=Choanephora cucurbitarum TaxID=101091 RepID=A0A1C7N513_9FUNG|nr:putative UDP-N-acetylglucosamine--peptide N-acetylglucosaminyltransferase SEC [Choanephora cucurbitarum]
MYPLLNDGAIPQTRSLKQPVDFNHVSHDDPAAFAYFQQELSSPLQLTPTTNQHPSIMVPPQSPTLASYYFENGWVNHYYDPKRKYLSSRRTEPSEVKRLHLDNNADEWREHLLQYAHTLYSTSPRNPYLLPLLHSLHDAYPSHLPTLLLLACVYYSYGEYSLSLKYNQLILKYDAHYVEAMSNIGTTLRSMGKTTEAERWWYQAVKLRPAYWDAVENLVGVLCAKTEGETRYQEALAVCDFVESFFFKQPTTPLKAPPQLPVHQLSRLQNLFYAKGNLKYALGDTLGAQREYEKGLELAFGGIDLMSLCRLICYTCHPTSPSTELPLLLLQPDQAARILQLAFPNANGLLPTLVSLTGPDAMAHIQQTNQTTSVLLLTLAKLYQDLLHSANVGAPKPTLAMLLPLYYMSLALHASPSTANNLGIILSSIPATVTMHAVKLTVQPLTGTMLAMQYYMYGLQLDPRHPHLYTNLGSLLKDMGHLNEAVSMYEKAVEFNPKFDVALANLGNAIKDLGRVQESVQWYRRAVEVNPNFVDAVCGLVNSLNGVCDWRGRGGVRQEASVDAYGQFIPPSPDQPPTGWMSHIVDIVNRQLEEGSLWGAGILNVAVHHKTLGESLVERWVAISGDSPVHWRARLADLQTASKKNEGGWLIRMVERIMRRLQYLWYVNRLQQKGHDITPETAIQYARPLIPAHLSLPPVPTVLPFHTFTYPLDARQIRLISHRNALRISHTALTSSWLPAHVYPPPPPPQHRLKIGYISSDFNNHPLSHLMQSVFGMHDRARYTVYCYATTPSDQSPYRLKIEQEAENFIDVSSWSNQQVVERVVSDGIHVLVNLNGYTKGARNEIFAARPCPVQCSFMGFAGTLGGQWCDYIVADPIVCPPEKVSDHVWRHQRGGQLQGGDLPGDLDPEQISDDFAYTEKFIYMPHSYFVNDHKQGFREEENLDWTREEEKRWQMRRELFPQLPDDVVIFANFNQLYKLEPATFRVWLKILERVPNSILWLLRFPPAGEHHLKRCALAWAGPHVAQRVVFTDVAPKHVHIHRGRVADLFLDTPECNAHTTAADILWSGTPILTFPKYIHKMCSRVGASIAMATGLGDAMVVMTEEAYEQRAVELAQSVTYTYLSTPTGMKRQGHGQLMQLRKQLFSTREQSRLFDTARWTRNLERGYAEAWRRWATGEAFEEDKDGCIWVTDPDDHIPS